MSQSKNVRVNYNYFKDGDGIWKRSPKSADEKPCLLSAYLVQSVRINGKPRQKATFLASIQRLSLAYPLGRLHFWQAVQKRIEPFLPSLSPEQQQHIKAKLLEYVPDVTKEEIAAAREEWAQREARLKDLLGRKA